MNVKHSDKVVKPKRRRKRKSKRRRRRKRKNIEFLRGGEGVEYDSLIINVRSILYFLSLGGHQLISGRHRCLDCLYLH